jgi:FtsZ-interacting cell division protein ZipA
MPELRWTLLLLGVLFLVVLAVWELRRQRQARGKATQARQADELPPAAPGSFDLPEIHAREAIRELPVVEIGGDRLASLSQNTVPTLDAESDAERTARPVEAAQQPEPLPAARTESAAAGASPAPADPGQEAPREPIVEWPEESARRIVALRLVAAGDRFPGRAVRQALVAEGFVLGRFSIFHRAGPDGRAVLSAASLTKPGTFDRDAIDMQRFGGLNLFAVLPGPLPPARAFDELVNAARGLNVRLQGALQDERGQPLTPTRAAAIRETLAAQADEIGSLAAPS